MKPIWKHMLLALLVCLVGTLPVAAATQPIEITYADWGELEDTQAFAAEFMKTHPNIKINFMVSTNVNDHHEKMKVMSASGTLPDIVRVNSQNAPQWLRPDIAVPLNDLVKRDRFDLSVYPPWLVEALTINGYLYSLPTRDGIPTDGFALNVDLFNSGGVQTPTGSWTWDDMLAILKKLTIPTADGTLQQYGVSHVAPAWYYNWVWSNGGELVRNGKTALTEPAAYEAIQWWADLAGKHKVAGTGIRTPFDNGKAALGNMALGGTKTTWKFDWRFLPYPHGKAGAIQRVVAHPVIINRNSPNVEAAWTFLKWLGSKEAQELLIFGLGYSGAPTHRDVLLSSRYLISSKPPYNLTDLTKVKMRPLPLIPGWDDHDAVVRKVFLEIQSGAETAAAVMKRNEPIFNELIAKGI